MNLDSLSFALSQISYSVANLTKKNFKSSVTEISHLVSEHGVEAERHLFRCLFSHVDFSGDGKSSGKDFHQIQYLIQECPGLITKAIFPSILCYAVDNTLHHQKSLKPSPQLLGQLSRALKLTRVQEVVFGLALYSSSNTDTSLYAAQFVRQKVTQLLNSYIDSDAVGGGSGEGLQDVPVEVLHLLLTHLLQAPDHFGVTAAQRAAFLGALRKDFPRDRVPVVLSPALYSETDDIDPEKLHPLSVTMPKMMDKSLGDVILELGYGLTSSVEECRSTLVQFGARDLTAASVAKALGVIAKTPSSLSDHITMQVLGGASGGVWSEGKEKADAAAQPSTWNVDVFVQVVKELAPYVNWREVVGELDHASFVVTTKPGLRLLVTALHRGLQDGFPIEMMYRGWNNTEGQMSLINLMLKNPDVFCFADYACHTVVVDILKTPPDEENRDIATWKSLDLVECLLRLSEAGHYQQASELFKFPVQHCPDMLVLSLLQIRTWNTLKRELLSTLMPIFLGNHPNSASVLHYAWHCQGQSTAIRTLVMHTMAEWYMRGEHHDQARLSRILDVAQDLKALSMLLSATPFAFVIDLACLASRREYLKLDKWLSDKIREHGEPFLQSCTLFLKRRCQQLVGGGGGKEEQPPTTTQQMKSQMLPSETVTTMLACMQACAGNVSSELSETILAMVSNAKMMLSKVRQGVAVGGGGGGGAPKAGPIGPALPPLPTAPPTNPISVMEPLGGLGGVSLGGAPAAASVAAPFPPSLGALSASAAASSPAKLFPTLSQSGQPPAVPPLSQQPALSQPALTQPTLSQAALSQPTLGQIGQPTSQAAGFNTMQSLSNHLQGLSLGTTASATSIAPPPPPPTSRGTPTLGGTTSLGSLSAQATLKQPPPPPPPVAQQADRLRQAPTSASDIASVRPSMSQQFSKEIEDEANSYFQRIYNHPPHPTISTDEVIEMLKRFKDSPSKKERDVFACMLRNLFEEYRFFPQYPDRELHTTAVLFGGIIEQGLVTYMDLGIALRYVLEAMKKTHNSKMYIFGIAALDRFKSRLKDYPQYCQHLASIPHFGQFPQHLREYVEFGARSKEPPNRPQGQVATRSVTPVTTTVVTTVAATTSAPPSAAMPTAAPPPASAPTSGAAVTLTSTAPTAIARPTTAAAIPSKQSIANATNIDTLLAGTEGRDEVAVPPENLQDKVFFIFNNLSLSNMDVKATELTDQVSEDHMTWVAQYLVMKRASIEHNFHTLYANFIDHLQQHEFTHMVVRETYRNIKVLLRSDKGVANFSDRSLLKNLGHWMGMLTLTKNKPILHLDIDLKSLLYEAYHKGAQELLYVVPFVAKVLESCAKSKVFRPPSPWTMAIMNVLAELHQEPDLKLNLKFEIEVLCKNLSIDINELSPGSYLKSTERLQYMEYQLSAPSKVPESATPQPEEPLQINMPTPVTTALMAGSAGGGGVVPAPAPPVATPAVAPPQPKFGYHEINVMSLAGLVPHTAISEHIALFQTHPQLKQCVRPAIERSVQELLLPVVERSIKIALTTCEQIVKKDFALDPEESRMRAAAHHMVRFMTAGMALITCRETLLISINSNLKADFLTSLRGATAQQKELIEQAAQVLSQDNVELACAFIQKNAVEKAIPDMDKRLATEYDLRKHARNENRRYCDPVVLTYQAERMPEQIRLKVGSVTHQQIAVYEEFARNVPGFLPTAQEASQTNAYTMKPAQPTHAGPTDEISAIYEKVAREMEQHLHALLAAGAGPGGGGAGGGGATGAHAAALHDLRDAVLVARQSRDVATAIGLLQKAVEGLLEGVTPAGGAPGGGTGGGGESEAMLRYRDCHLLALKALQDQRAYGPQWTNKQVTRVLVDCRDEHKYNMEAVHLLLRSQLISMPQYDLHLAQMMNNGLHYMAVAFAMQLIQRLFVDDKQAASHVTEADFVNTIETLARIAAHSRQAPEGLGALIETVRQHGDGGLMVERAPGGPTSMMHSGISQARELDDPPGLHEKTEYLLREWVNMYHSPGAGRDSTKAFSAFVANMHSQGILKTDDLITRFFRLCTEMCVDLCYRALADSSHSLTLIRANCFHTLDAFVRLIALLVKHSGDTNNTVTKINLLNKVLGIVAGVLLQDHEVRHTEFQQLPYHRIFIMLFIELNAPEHVLESINFQVLTAFCNTFHILRPAKAPAFAYAWLELVSHRVFIGRMLAITPQQRGWSMYAQLLIDLFKFLTPYLRNAELAKPTQLLYKGTLRVLLVLLHDFPEFLCDYHYAFCDVVPPNCIQMRNLILSAFPRNMRLPDPFTPNLKVDMLSEITHAPRIMTNFGDMIRPISFKKDLDSYLKTRSPVTFLSELRSNLQVSSEPGMRYNMPLTNALVLYVGTQAIGHIHSKGLTPSMSTIAHSSHMDIFQNLAVDLDTEGRYLFLNAIANQLRYPNSHTHYFSCSLLYLFAEANTEAIQEQITRVLLERLIVNRPHPWGLLITFIELIKNPSFKFWNHNFVHCAPEIQKLFESVARSCVQPKQPAATPLREQDAHKIH